MTARRRRFKMTSEELRWGAVRSDWRTAAIAMCNSTRRTSCLRRVGSVFRRCSMRGQCGPAPTVSAHDENGAVVTHLREFGQDDFVTGVPSGLTARST